MQDQSTQNSSKDLTKKSSQCSTELSRGQKSHKGWCRTIQYRAHQRTSEKNAGLVNTWLSRGQKSHRWGWRTDRSSWDLTEVTSQTRIQDKLAQCLVGNGNFFLFLLTEGIRQKAINAAFEKSNSYYRFANEPAEIKISTSSNLGLLHFFLPQFPTCNAGPQLGCHKDCLVNIDKANPHLQHL